MTILPFSTVLSSRRFLKTLLLLVTSFGSTSAAIDTVSGIEDFNVDVDNPTKGLSSPSSSSFLAAAPHAQRGTEIHRPRNNSSRTLKKKKVQTTGIPPIPVTPGDATTCGLVPGPNGGVASVESFKKTLCLAPNWVYCINAPCEQEVVTEANGITYGGKPFVKCSCWQQPGAGTETELQRLSNVPYAKGSGASCVLGKTYGTAPSADTGGRAMCAAMRAGELISTYGPDGEIYDFESETGGYIGPEPNDIISRVKCAARTPWAWCWGAPCVVDLTSPTGITCHCPYMVSDSSTDQSLFLDQSTKCDNNACDTIQNSGPAGTLGENVWNSKLCETD